VNRRAEPVGDAAKELRVVVFASGSGSNFESLAAYEPPVRLWRVVALVTNRAGVGATVRADRLGIPVRVVPTAGRTAEEVSGATLSALSDLRADIVCLAGYLRLVPEAVIARFRGRIVNIHPALLPRFGGEGMYGIRIHRAVLEAGERVTGATVHHVTEEYDKGPVIDREEVPVLEGDTPESLARRVLRVEHRLYPRTLDLLVRDLSTNAASDLHIAK